MLLHYRVIDIAKNINMKILKIMHYENDLGNNSAKILSSLGFTGSRHEFR